jgi:hypothetical protein
MMKYVILFTTLEIVSLSLIILPVSRNYHFLSCLRTILQKHIAQRTNLVASFPDYTHNTVLTSSKLDTSQMVDTVLRNINGETGLPVHVHQLDIEQPDKYPFILPYKLDSYVILTVPVMEIELLHLLITQVKALSSLIPFNLHASFIFVVTGSFDNIKLVL